MNMKRKVSQLRPYSESQYYSSEQMELILGTIRLKPGSDRELVQREIERVAIIACELSRILEEGEIRPASVRARKLRALSTLSKRTLAGLQEALQEGYLELAARSLAEQGDPPPGCQVEPFFPADCPGNAPGGSPSQCDEGAMTTSDSGGPSVAPDLAYWPVEDQLLQFRRMLGWMVRCIEEAAASAEQEVGDGGNRPKEHLDALVEGLAAIFHKHSVDPPVAYRARDSEEVKGALIDFIEACLAPLQGGSSKDKYRRRSILERLEKLKSDAG
jgi:hypothetical protein